MSTFAPPVRRGQFLYSSVLYADAGNENHHPRASVAELAELLRPETRYKNKKPVTPAKDPVGHWYTAQLIHYGLPTTKDKNAAKVRLLNALNSFKLEIPAWILKIEAELKKEWEGENRKLKRTGKAASGAKAAGSTGKASSASASSQNVNVTVNFALPSSLLMVEQLGIEKGISAPKPASKTNAAGKRKREDITTDNNSTPSRTTQLKPPKKPRVKQEPKSTLFPRSRQHIKQEPVDATYSQDASADPDYIIFSGTYRITCPTAIDLFPYLSPHNLRLILCKDEHRDVWWASFTWGAWAGIIHMNPGPSFDTLGQPSTLGWRLRDEDTGELRFGKNCTGDMTFYNDQTIRGYLYNVPSVGTLEFWGPRLEERGRGDRSWKSGDEFQEKWDAFVREAYGR